MIKPALPEYESDRLQTLRALNLLDSEPAERFDRLTRMAKRLFQVPIAAITLVDSERQWFLSSFGLNVEETPRDISFSGHAILTQHQLVVPNTKLDERFADNPMVTGEPAIVFYAGIPIVVNQHKVGTLCVIDHVAREFSAEDVELLDDLARMVEKELVAVQQNSMDELTGISNRRGFYLIAEHSLSLCYRHKTEATLVMFDLDNLREINVNFGYAEGSRVISLFAQHLQQFFRDSDLVGRFTGDTFGVLLLNTSPTYAKQVLKKFEHSMIKLNNLAQLKDPLTFSTGVATFDPAKPTSMQTMFEHANDHLKKQKKYSVSR